jgi:hypothetical protein
MNLDKQLTWDVLSGNYASISHVWGKELLDVVSAQEQTSIP